MKGYTKREIIENEWDIEDFGKCADCGLWFPIGEMCEDDGIDYCPNCL